MTGAVRVALAAGAGLVVATAVLGQAPPATPAPDVTVVSEFVVTAHAGGPAWWRVSSPHGAVWIMGVPEDLPRGLAWSQSLLRARLKRARELITDPTVRIGLGDILPLLRIRGQLRAHGRMEDVLAPDLRARFLADKAKLTRDPRAYSGWSPLIAGLLMVSDFRREAGLETREPDRAIAALARRMGVKVIPGGTFRAVDLARTAAASQGAAGQACLADALDEIESGADRARAAAQGWARGDVAQALTAARGYDRCLASLSAGTSLGDETARDAASTIAAAAELGGDSVAIVDLRTLLSRDGVLQRLKAQGLQVETPQ